jgi:hypothetical protein
VVAEGGSLQAQPIKVWRAQDRRFAISPLNMRHTITAPLVNDDQQHVLFRHIGS